MKKLQFHQKYVGNSHLRKNDEVKRGWNRNTVIRILKNVTYLGSVSNGNVKKINYKSDKVIIMPVEERIIVEDMHEALVDKETFDIVQDMIKSRTGVRERNYEWLLKGLLVCKECGKKLSIVPQKKKTKTTFYVRCNTYACNTHLHLCTPHSNNLEKLTNYVLEQIKARCKEFLDESKYLNVANSSKDKILKDRFNFKNEILVLEKKLKDIDKMIDKLYEDKCKGLFEDEDFTRLYSKQKEIRKDTTERIKCLEKQIENKDSSVDINKLVKDFVELKEITRTMLVSLIDRVEVSEDKEITIYYKFNILNMRKLNDDEELINVGQIKKSSQQNIITIIVLIILAGVSINLVFGNLGIVTKAKEAKELQKQAQANEQVALGELSNEMYTMLGTDATKKDNPTEKSGVEKLKEAKTYMQEDTIVKDSNQNIIKIPKGFKIAEDSGKNVTEGIVIEDNDIIEGIGNNRGNQYVWIPIGIGIKKADGTTVDITLGRYTFASNGTPTLKQNAEKYMDDSQEVLIDSYYRELPTYRQGVASEALDGLNTTSRGKKKTDGTYGSRSSFQTHFFTNFYKFFKLRLRSCYKN